MLDFRSKGRDHLSLPKLYAIRPSLQMWSGTKSSAPKTFRNTRDTWRIVSTEGAQNNDDWLSKTDLRNI